MSLETPPLSIAKSRKISIFFPNTSLNWNLKFYQIFFDAFPLIKKSSLKRCAMSIYITQCNIIIFCYVQLFLNNIADKLQRWPTVPDRINLWSIKKVLWMKHFITSSVSEFCKSNRIFQKQSFCFLFFNFLTPRAGCLKELMENLLFGSMGHF